MRDSKLVYALSHLDIYEFNRFKKFVDSPYFNANEKIKAFLNILDSYFKGKKDIPSKEGVFKELYPDEPYKDNRFRKLSTDLLSLFEDFLAHERYFNKDLSRVNDLLASLGERRLEKLYRGVVNKAKRHTEKSFSKTSEFYFEQYSLQKNIFNLTTEFERLAKSKSEISDFNIPHISYNLDLFYIIEKLRYQCAIHSWNDIHKQRIEINFVDDIVKIVENSALLRNRVVEIYYLIYKTHVEEDNPNHYNKLKELIEKYLQIFPRDEAKEIFEAAFTYCTKRINRGYAEYQSEVLSLYKKALETDVLLIDGFLSPTTFRNIVTYGLRLKDYHWTESFINEFSNQLNPKFRKSVVSYNLGLLSFYKKKFDDVLSHLRDFDYDEIQYSLGAKSILLATYYELEEIEVLYSFFDSFKTYLDRKKGIPDRVKLGYINLIKFTRKLLQIKYSSKGELSKLKEDILQTKIVFSKQWLLDKIESSN